MVCPVTPSVVVVAFVVEKRVVVASVAKKRVAVAFTKFDEVAKRFDEVELVVDNRSDEKQRGDLLDCVRYGFWTWCNDFEINMRKYGVK